jgi:lipoprotein-anchoring transpeptidase ErfK/SrfK
MYLERREFIAAIAATLVTARPAFAHQEPPFALPEDYLPTLVDVPPFLPPGVIHVFPDEFRLFLTLPNAQALRYTVGVGKPGLYHSGQFTVGMKREWPSWRPTTAMIKRNPDAYARYADGMPGGEDNPLGARALYLFDGNGHDTYLRIHGTNKPRTIGSAVSNGCARLTNEHITDLYDRVPIGTQVFLHEQAAA